MKLYVCLLVMLVSTCSAIPAVTLSQTDNNPDIGASHMTGKPYISTKVQIMLDMLYLTIKGSIFLKNRHFITQERFNKLIYGINTINKCGT